MRLHHDIPAGTVTRLSVHCRALKGNLLGDPHLRAVDIWTPPGHDGRGLPLLVDLVGFTGSGLSHTNWKNFGENVPERLDRLTAEGLLPPVAVAFPDGFTRLGGNQYVDSPVLGNWMTAICDEIVPAVEAHIGCGGEGRRGVFGKSSGGYGAIIHAMKRPDVWSAAACHSGDMAFELVYLAEMPDTLRALAKHGMSVANFMAALERSYARKVGGQDTHVLMSLAMCATYDPAPDEPYGVRLPVTSDTCEVIPERWANWLAWDPTVIALDHVEALRSMKALFIDCGDQDQYNLVYGARRLHRTLTRAGVPHRYEEFPDNHSGIDYRMDESLPFLAAALYG
ncbi:alpha/beta hydrolase [Indioceanicola profundi]|uniref:alpha/beta hydrolase n=1 Tax=Indioceanicola profundi TaxID=2220096 RepID=UPI000E6A9FED|nr:alpha/beta hydrolase-fold protein [Indioceanicola profundi]